jgi:hypothetical protein
MTLDLCISVGMITLTHQSIEKGLTQLIWYSSVDWTGALELEEEGRAVLAFAGSFFTDSCFDLAFSGMLADSVMRYDSRPQINTVRAACQIDVLWRCVM